MTTPELIAAIKDLILILAAIVTATVAIKGLNKWSQELKGKAQFEAAFDLAKSTYKLRNELHRSRSRLVVPGEFPKGYLLGRKEEENDVSEADAFAHVLTNRFKLVIIALDDFEAHALAAEALWGKPSRTATDALRQCVRALNGAMQAFVDDKAARGDHFRNDPEFGQSIRAKVFSSEGEASPLGAQIDSAVSSIEDLLRPHMRQQP